MFLIRKLDFNEKTNGMIGDDINRFPQTVVRNRTEDPKRNEDIRGKPGITGVSVRKRFGNNV
jgi:hypothetical protein